MSGRAPVGSPQSPKRPPTRRNPTKAQTLSPGQVEPAPAQRRGPASAPIVETRNRAGAEWPAGDEGGRPATAGPSPACSASNNWAPNRLIVGASRKLRGGSLLTVRPGEVLRTMVVVRRRCMASVRILWPPAWYCSATLAGMRSRPLDSGLTVVTGLVCGLVSLAVGRPRTQVLTARQGPGGVYCSYPDECVVSQVTGLVARPQLLQLHTRAGAGVQNSLCWALGMPAADACSMAASTWSALASSASAAKIAFLIATARWRAPQRSFSGEYDPGAGPDSRGRPPQATRPPSARRPGSWANRAGAGSPATTQ